MTLPPVIKASVSGSEVDEELSVLIKLPVRLLHRSRSRRDRHPEGSPQFSSEILTQTALHRVRHLYRRATVEVNKLQPRMDVNRPDTLMLALTPSFLDGSHDHWRRNLGSKVNRRVFEAGSSHTVCQRN